MWEAIIALCAVILFLLMIWRKSKFPDAVHLPPGPRPVPFIGNLLKARGNIHEMLHNLAPIYGPVMTLWIGRRPLVIVNDYAVAVKVLKSNDFAGKPYGELGAIQGSEDRFTFQDLSSSVVEKREIISKVFSGKSFETVLEEAVSFNLIEMFKALEANYDRVEFDPADEIDTFVHNSMRHMIFGQNCSLSSEKLYNSTEELSYFALLSSSVFPVFKLFSTTYNRLQTQYLQDEVDLKLAFHSAILTEPSTSTDCIARMLMSLHGQTREKPVRIYEAICTDIFLAGCESMAPSIKWALLYFVTWPEIQRKIQSELDARFGFPSKGKLIKIDEALSVPYLHAAIYETFRLSSVVPYIGCKTMTDTNLRGFSLKKETAVFLNVYSMHLDPNYWDDPHEFKPGRFLHAHSGAVEDEKIKGFLPFGSGSRGCVTKQLALSMLSFVLANLLHKYEFQVSPWSPKPSMCGSAKFVLSPKPYQIKLKERR